MGRSLGQLLLQIFSRQCSIFNKTSPFPKELFETNIETPEINPNPRGQSQTSTQTSLSEYFSKTENPSALLAVANDKLGSIDTTSNTVIYTEASKSDTGGTGIGIYVTSKENWHFKLSDSISIFAAEMTSIKTAAETFTHKQSQNQLTICIDSFSSIQSLSSRHYLQPKHPHQYLQRSQQIPHVHCMGSKSYWNPRQ